MCPPLLENDPEAWVEEFDNPFNLKFPLAPNEDIGEPMKMPTLQPMQARAQPGKGIHFPIPPWPYELY